MGEGSVDIAAEAEPRLSKDNEEIGNLTIMHRDLKESDCKATSSGCNVHVYVCYYRTFATEYSIPREATTTTSTSRVVVLMRFPVFARDCLEEG